MLGLNEYYINNERFNTVIKEIEEFFKKENIELDIRMCSDPFDDVVHFRYSKNGFTRCTAITVELIMLADDIYEVIAALIRQLKDELEYLDNVCVSNMYPSLDIPMEIR